MHKANSSHTVAWLREFDAAGIPVDLSVAELNVEIEQVGGGWDNLLFDLPDGRAGCIIDLLIINQTSRLIRIRNIELRPPWPNSDFEWLPDPKEAGPDRFNYNFPGKGAPTFPREQVINHALLGRRILKPGCPLEGWLLGIGNHKPEKLLLGAPLELALAIIGDNHNEYAETITLLIDPDWKRPESERKIARERLFAGKQKPILGSQNLAHTRKTGGAGLPNPYQAAEAKSRPKGL